MAGGTLSVVWCFAALSLSMVTDTPSTSWYSEIDFISKAIKSTASYALGQASDSLPDVLSRLSNATSSEIRKSLAALKFYVQVQAPNDEGVEQLI